jgi:hypothetical protein
MDIETKNIDSSGYFIWAKDKEETLVKVANTDKCQFFHKYKGYSFNRKYIDEKESRDNLNLTEIGVYVHAKQLKASCQMRIHSQDIKEYHIGMWVMPYSLFIKKRRIITNTHSDTMREKDEQYVINDFFVNATKVNSKETQTKLN